MLKSTVRRSACDQCRAKRVRCLRPQDSTAPCARCSYIGTRCVTGSPGQPGRPPKHRLAGTPRSTATTPADASSPMTDMGHVGSEAAASTSPARASQHRGDTQALGNRSDHTAHRPAIYDSQSLSEASMTHEMQPDFWSAAGNNAAFFSTASIDQDPAPGQQILSIVEQMSNASQLQGLLSTDEDLNAMLHLSGETLNMELDPLFNQQPKDNVLPLAPLPQYFSAASCLAGFREEVDHRIATVDEYYSEPHKVIQRCKEEGTEAGPDVENPAALLLTCTKKLIDIIQGINPSTSQQVQTQASEDALSTEVVLLALSSYLALMRLFDSLFHRIHKYLCKVPPEAYLSIKVKSVLRIGGVSSLQDMPLKVYALGILDAIQSQVKTLEHCMGIPAEYCLSGEAAPKPTGIFHRADRKRLFWVVIAQEDVKSRRGTKSYVESIRTSIKESLAYLED